MNNGEWRLESELIQASGDDANASRCGGAFFVDAATPELINCIIAANEAIDDGDGSLGGGLFIENNDIPVMTNCFFNGNTPDIIHHFDDSDTSYTDIQTLIAAFENVNDGCMQADPLFFMHGPDALQGTWAGKLAIDDGARTVLTATTPLFAGMDFAALY